MAGRVVVITGGTSGVGRACAQLFAREGDDVTVLARGKDGLAGAVADVEREGRRALGIEVDLADAGAIAAAADQIERELGPIDVWINNAMTSVFSPIKQMTTDELRRVTEVTYMGVAYGSMVAVERMRGRNRGVIVQVGSALSYRGIPLQSAYCAAKHAIVGFTESLRTELLHDKVNIKVSVVHLPAVNTPQFEHVLSRMERRAQPVPPIYQPEVPARAVYRAAHGKDRVLYVGFSTVKAVWGNRIAPKYADGYLARTGYESQQTDEPDPHDRPANLWEPVPGDPGAHGRFDNRSRENGLIIAGLHLRLVLVGILVVVILVVALVLALLLD